MDLANRIPNVRFRLSSVEVTQLDDTLMDMMVNAPDRLARHVHAPLQSGSERILKLMGRAWYTAAEYRKRLERLAERIDTFGLGADIIVGFPGEKDRALLSPSGQARWAAISSANGLPVYGGEKGMVCGLNTWWLLPRVVPCHCMNR